MQRFRISVVQTTMLSLCFYITNNGASSLCKRVGGIQLSGCNSSIGHRGQLTPVPIQRAWWDACVNNWEESSVIRTDSVVIKTCCGDVLMCPPLVINSWRTRINSPAPLSNVWYWKSTWWCLSVLQPSTRRSRFSMNLCLGGFPTRRLRSCRCTLQILSWRLQLHPTASPWSARKTLSGWRQRETCWGSESQSGPQTSHWEDVLPQGKTSRLRSWSLSQSCTNVAASCWWGFNLYLDVHHIIAL